MTLSPARVLVVGGANLDTVARTHDAVMPGTSNPGRTRQSAGGVARNIADNLGRLGVAATLVAAIADDPAGRIVGESVPRLTPLPADSTGTYTAVLDDGGELVVAVADMAATDALLPEHLPPLDAGWLVLDANLPVPVVRHCLRMSTASVVLDPVSVAKAARLREEPLPIHTLTPNTAELAAITGHDDEHAAIASLLERGVAWVWLRRGPLPSRLVGPGVDLQVPTGRGSVVDVTGAGDAMTAAYVHRLLAGDPPPLAATYGATAAALTAAVSGAVREDLTADLLQHTHEETT